MKLRFLACFLLLAPAALCGSARALAPGGKIPGFALNTLDGKRTTFEDLLKDGKPLLISFFATWCLPCNEEVPDLKKIHDAGKIKVALISLDTDAPAQEIKAWVSSRSVENLSVLLDPKGIAGERFGVISGGGRADLPHVFLISPQGTLIWDHRGLDKKLAVHVAAEASKWLLESGKAASAKKEETPPNSVWLLFTNSANGWLISCDCPSQPLGGLSRRAGFIEQEKSRLEPLLIVDTGDNLPSQADEKKSLAVARSLNLIPYDAMVPGDQEFVLGAKFALDRILLPDRPYLTANLAICPDKKSCVVPYQGYKIVEKGGLKIGLIGIFHEDTIALAPEPLKKALKVFPVEKKLREALKAIRPQSDIIILLSHSGMAQDMLIAEKIPGIDIIVGGHSQDLIKTPVTVGKTKIIQAGPGGQYVGKTLLVKNPEGVELVSYELIPMGIDVPANAQIARFNE